MNAPKRSVVLAALLAIVLLAACVSFLHWENAVSLRGTASAEDYAQLCRGQALTLESKRRDDERDYTLYTDGEKEFGLHLADPWVDRGVLHVRGTLLRIDQAAGPVNVRVGLIPVQEEHASVAGQEALLLNTQMVREHDFAGENGYDDHCGFHAAAQVKRLDDSGAQFRIVLVDESDTDGRMIATDMVICPIEGGLAFARSDLPESEVQHAH